MQVRECDKEKVTEREQGGERGRERQTRVRNVEKAVEPDAILVRLRDKEGTERQNSLTGTLGNGRHRIGGGLATDHRWAPYAETRGDHWEYASSSRKRRDTKSKGEEHGPLGGFQNTMNEQTSWFQGGNQRYLQRTETKHSSDKGINT